MPSGDVRCHSGAVPSPVENLPSSCDIRQGCHHSIMRPIPTDVPVDHSITAWCNSNCGMSSLFLDLRFLVLTQLYTTLSLLTISHLGKTTAQRKTISQKPHPSLNCRQMLEECHNPRYCPRILVTGNTRGVGRTEAVAVGGNLSSTGHSVNKIWQVMEGAKT